MAQTDPYYATFHTCMYGGQRAKSRTIAANFPEILELSVECDRQHAHLPWGKTSQGFATAEEVEYPLQLCKEWASRTWSQRLLRLASTSATQTNELEHSRSNRPRNPWPSCQNTRQWPLHVSPTTHRHSKPET